MVSLCVLSALFLQKSAWSIVFEILIRKWRKELYLRPTKKFLRVLSGVSEIHCDALGPHWDVKIPSRSRPRIPTGNL